MNRRLAAILWILAALLLVGTLPAAGPSDTTIPINYGPTPTAMPYSGQNGYSVVASKQVATTTLGNGFQSPLRGDIDGKTGETDGMGG